MRILDFPHAGEYLSDAGQAVWGEGSAEAQGWFEAQLHDLKHSGPDPVLAELRRLVGLKPEQVGLVDDLAYLEKRAAQMQYPLFLAAGWPIGDGAVESGNKLVVEARLKGSGMHWAREHVDPMLALRNIVCSDRWAEAWPQITQTLRQQARQRRSARHEKRRQATQPAETAQSPAAPIRAGLAKTQLAPSQYHPKRPRPSHGGRLPIILGVICPSVERVSSHPSSTLTQNPEPHSPAVTSLTGPGGLCYTPWHNRINSTKATNRTSK